MFNLTSEADEATEVIAELGSFVHPVTDIVSEVHQMADAAGDNGTFLEPGSFVHPVTDIVLEVHQTADAAGDNGTFQWNLVVLYIQSPI